MGIMTYREANQVLWRGCRPGHNGTQVYWRAGTNFVGRTALIPVHASMTRFLTYFDISSTDNIMCTAELRMYNDAAGLEWIFGTVRSQVNFNAQVKICNFWPPLELPFNWTIDVNLSAGNWTSVAILGWQE